MGPGWEDGGGLYTFFPTEHDEEGGQQGDEGGQDGPAGKQRGEQAATHPLLDPQQYSAVQIEQSLEQDIASFLIRN